MKKFRRAIFCYYILRFDRHLHAWMINILGTTKTDGMITIGASARHKVAQWLTDLYDKKLDFEIILHILTGDEFFERNMTDVQKLEKIARKNITELWDTDPIFDKFPHLRKLGRNREFEEWWNSGKQKIK